MLNRVLSATRSFVALSIVAIGFWATAGTFEARVGSGAVTAQAPDNHMSCPVGDHTHTQEREVCTQHN